MFNKGGIMSAGDKPTTAAEYFDGKVFLVNDHQAVELIPEGDMLRRVIVCCDCGLAHLMSIDRRGRKAYFVREDGPLAQDIREKTTGEGHHFKLLEKLRALASALEESENLNAELHQRFDPLLDWGNRTNELAAALEARARANERIAEQARKIEALEKDRKRREQKLAELEAELAEAVRLAAYRWKLIEGMDALALVENEAAEKRLADAVNLASPDNRASAPPRRSQEALSVGPRPPRRPGQATKGD